MSKHPSINTQWDIKVEGKLNRNNIIFHTNKYQTLVSKLKKYNNFIKKIKEPRDGRYMGM
tara:strand:- start:42 stop:221 length:180 start_codon:yes stop_codon:yes gene_type:complete